jgi:apolipoprotein N-acyltransferase
MTNTKFKNILFNNFVFYSLIIISGIIWGLGQNPDYNYIRFFGLIPFLLIVFYRKRYILESILFGTVAYSMNFYWLFITLHETGRYHVVPATLIPFLLCVYYALQYPIIAIIYRKCLEINKKYFYYALPFLFVAVDFIFPKIFRHTIGDSLIGNFYLIQMIDITGMSGIILIIMFFNLGIFSLLKKLVKKEEIKAINFIFILPVVIAFLYGAYRVDYLENISKKLPATYASMVQGNISGKQKQSYEYFQTNIDRYNMLTEKTVNEDKPDFVIWPESVFNRAYNGTNESLQQFILKKYPPLILGIVVWHGQEISNSAILVQDRKQENRYDKKKLLIFGEYVPFEKTFPFLKKLTMLYKSETPGTTPSIFTIGKVKANISICFEDLFPEDERKKNLEGSNLMINITNDSWYGKDLGPLHHSIIARLRAIENRRSFYRCTATGLTTASDLTGKVVAKGKMWEPVIVKAKLPLYSEKTIYSYTGEIISYFCIGISCLLILLSFIIFLKRKFTKKGIVFDTNDIK